MAVEWADLYADLRDLDDVQEIEDKLTELYSAYSHDVTPDEIIDNLEAYQFNHNVKRLTYDVVAKFVREEMLSQRRQGSNFSKKAAQVPTYSAVSFAKVKQEKVSDFGGGIDTSIYGVSGVLTPVKPSVSSMYQTPTPGKRIGGFTPVKKEESGMAHLLATPPAQGYTARTNSGKVEAALHDKDFTFRSETRSDDRTRAAIQVSREVTTAVEFMYMKTGAKSDALDEHLVTFGEELRAFHGLAEPAQNFQLASQSSILAVGRVCCDAEGRLNPDSVMLEGSREACDGFRVPLSLVDLKEFSLFPGQVIAVEGTNVDGSGLVASKIYQGAPLSLPSTPRRELMRTMHTDPEGQQGEPLHIMIGYGPYTTTEGLDYQPLSDLLAVAERDRPDVVILMGPFVDAKHPLVAGGDLDVTFAQLFEEALAQRLRAFVEHHGRTQFVIIPALGDVTNDYVFPQPLMDERLFNHPRIITLPNPAMFFVNEVLFGVVTNDVLFHISTEETERHAADAGPPERVKGVIDHLIQQRSFYPLFPPPLEAQVDISPETMKQLRFEDFTPDVLILPSAVKAFIKEVNGVLAINPGRLCMGAAGGTYSTLTVYTIESSKLSIGSADDYILHKVAARSLAKIVRI